MTSRSRATLRARVGRLLVARGQRWSHSEAQREGQRVVAILGMHRSGTSSLAGSLEEAGLYLGGSDVAGKSRWNARGNRESSTLMRIHDDLLEANGGRWDRPPEQVAWSAEHRARRDRFIASRASHGIWGFKDPRTLLTFEGWIEALPGLEMVATIRHPVAVAESLLRRAGRGSLEAWLDLWLAYDERLLRLADTYHFPIIDFDLPDEQYQQRLAEITTDLGLPARQRRERFFESSLRSPGPAADVAVRAEIEEVHRRLSAIAAQQLADPSRKKS